MAGNAAAWATAGAVLVGGCCGVTPKGVEAVVSELAGSTRVVPG